MKGSAVSLNGVNIYRSYPSNREEFEEGLLPDNFGKKQTLYGMPCLYPITFGGIQNSSKLRILFGYGLPCMYSGVEMIDPKALSHMLKNKTFFRPASQVIEMLSKYKDTISGMEKEAIDTITKRSKIHPDLNIKQILEEVEAVYIKNLYKKQAPIFYELREMFKKLPEDYGNKFEALMYDTDLKLTKQPLFVPFSANEFKYKLVKIKETFVQSDNTKAKKVINKLIKESKRLAIHTNDETMEHQRKTIGMLDWVLRKSILKDDAQLNELISGAKDRLANKETVIPFSRKSFIYDLSKIIKPLNNPEIEGKIISEAQKLPTSSQDFNAYMLKISSDTPDKIGFRLLWPYLASVEHIFPRSCGGADVMANFGGATTRENSARKSIDFTEQLKLRPNTPLYCQKYVDRLIELYHNGVFSKNRINPKYIEDFRNTVLTQSKGQVNLDISKMYAKS